MTENHSRRQSHWRIFLYVAAIVAIIGVAAPLATNLVGQQPVVRPPELADKPQVIALSPGQLPSSVPVPSASPVPNPNYPNSIPNPSPNAPMVFGAFQGQPGQPTPIGFMPGMSPPTGAVSFAGPAMAGGMTQTNGTTTILSMPMSREQMEMHQQVQAAVERYRSADEKDKDARKSEAVKLLSQQFDQKQQQHAERLKQLKAEVERTEKLLQTRVERKNEIVERRLNELIGGQDPLSWESPMVMGQAPGNFGSGGGQSQVFYFPGQRSETIISPNNTTEYRATQTLSNQPPAGWNAGNSPGRPGEGGPRGSSGNPAGHGDGAMNNPLSRTVAGGDMRGMSPMHSQLSQAVMEVQRLKDEFDRASPPQRQSIIAQVAARKAYWKLFLDQLGQQRDSLVAMREGDRKRLELAEEAVSIITEEVQQGIKSGLDVNTAKQQLIAIKSQLDVLEVNLNGLQQLIISAQEIATTLDRIGNTGEKAEEQ